MNEIIHKDDIDQLKFVLNHVKGQSYIDCAHEVQDFMINNLNTLELEPIHHFSPGAYVRQLDVQAGVLVVSKMHRTEHIGIMLKGSMTVLTENGVELVEAPQVIKTMPGTKRVVYFHEDSSFVTIHPTTETDLEKIESEVIVPFEQEKLFLQSQGELK